MDSTIHNTNLTTDNPIERLDELRAQINIWAKDAGFQAVGVSDMAVGPYVERLDSWISNGYQADMDWISDRRELRANPETLVEGSVRVISLRMNYQPPDTQPLEILKSSDKAYISRYALGRDYHKLIRSRLAKIAKLIEAWAQENLGESSIQRAFVDSAPVLEKPLAEKAGLGWIGKNSLLLNRDAGSWFFLGEIYTSLPLKTDDIEVEDECGKCKACLKICPTDAFPTPYVLDANKCISYLTIENKGSIPIELRSKMGNRVFGCDDCQLVCPWNRFSKHSDETDFKPRHNLDAQSLTELFTWTNEEFLTKTAGSPIRRTGYEGWQRNLAVGIGNGPASKQALAVLTNIESDSVLVHEHVEWALKQLKEKAKKTMTNNTHTDVAHEKEGSLTGQLLVAMPGLLDPSFSGTVTLICEHSDEGAIGFVINQPLELDLASVLEQIGLDVSNDIVKQPVLSGGPVAVERGFVVHRACETEWQSSMKISDEISVTTSDDIIKAMAEGKAPSGATLILGYAGWAQGQLESELLENSWLTLPASTDVVFDTEFDQRLKVATFSAGIDFSRMSSEAGHA